jgi:cysteine desulfuration protein SufE
MTTSPSSVPDSGTPGAEGALPPEIAKVLDRFGRLGREEKMQALVAYAKKLEPLPERLTQLDRAEFTVPECQTRVDLFAELERGGGLHFYADVNARQSPTIAAVLAIVLSAVNGRPPATTLAIPSDFVRRLMEGIGLAAREVGLNAMIQRLKRHAATAQRMLEAGTAGTAGTEDAPVLVHSP